MCTQKFSSLTLQCSILGIATLAFASPACAAKIVNMDTIPYDLDVTVAGEKQQVSIEPNAFWETSLQPVSVRVNGKNIKLDFDGEYSIWKGGTFAKQKTGPSQRGQH